MQIDLSYRRDDRHRIRGGIWLCPALAADGPGNPPAARSEQITAWIADLDADELCRSRASATRGLVRCSAGRPFRSVGGCRRASAWTSSRSSSMRARSSPTAVSRGKQATSAEAGAALQRLAGADDQRLARRAGEAFETYQSGRLEATIAKIEQLGGRVERAGDALGGAAIAVYFGRRWQGGDAGIEMLKSLPDLASTSVVGSKAIELSATRLCPTWPPCPKLEEARFPRP